MLAQASCSPERRKGAGCSTPSGGAHAHRTANGGTLYRYHMAAEPLAQAIELHAAFAFFAAVNCSMIDSDPSTAPKKDHGDVDCSPL